MGRLIDSPVVVCFVPADHVDVNGAVLHANLCDLPSAIDGEVQDSVSARRNALDIAFKYFEASHGESQLVSLTRSSVNNKHSLVVVFVPCEYLCSGVNERSTANVVVTDMSLGIASVERERSAIHLGNSYVSKSSGLNVKFVGDRIQGVVLGMTNEVEVGGVASGGSDGQRLRAGPGGVGGTSSSCSQVRWANLEEVGLQFLLRVFLAVHTAILSDHSSVVVRCVSTRMT